MDAPVLDPWFCELLVEADTIYEAVGGRQARTAAVAIALGKIIATQKSRVDSLHALIDETVRRCRVARADSAANDVS